MFNLEHCNIRGLIIHILFCKTGVSSYLSTRQILLVSSIKLYMPITTKTKLNIRHSIHVKIQSDKKYIIDCIRNF